MCASLLTNEPVTLKEIPRIEDVNDLEAVLKSIGVNIRWSGNDMTLIAPKKINLKEINSQTASKIRVILLFIGALANRLKNFSLPRAGGCKLGKRTITPHLFGLEKLGMKISCDPTAYKIKKPHTAGLVVIENPQDLPAEYDEIWEPMIELEILAPTVYLGPIMKLKEIFQKRQGQ